MGINPITKTVNNKQPQIKSREFNFQHWKPATANFMKIVEEDKIDIIFIHEPYTFQSRTAGILNKLKKPSLKEKEDA